MPLTTQTKITKRDEVELISFLVNGGIPSDFIMNEKRMLYILSKWESRGLFECGVSLVTGWLTDRGIEAAKYATDDATDTATTE
jgi:hypothetical protein